MRAWECKFMGRPVGTKLPRKHVTDHVLAETPQGVRAKLAERWDARYLVVKRLKRPMLRLVEGGKA